MPNSIIQVGVVTWKAQVFDPLLRQESPLKTFRLWSYNGVLLFQMQT